MALLMAREAFATAGTKKGDHGRVIAAGEIVEDTDPVVKGHENLFQPVGVRSHGRDVESATAAPGEKRSVARKRS
jgi:hypothetical protein